MLGMKIAGSVTVASRIHGTVVPARRGYRVEKRLGFVRLDDYARHPDLRGEAPYISLEVVSGLKNHRCRSRARIPAHRARQVITVDPRCDQVCHDQVRKVLLIRARPSRPSTQVVTV